MNTNSRQTITNPHLHIPRLFRSQIDGRCQLQRITKQEHDAIEWVDEWTTGADAVDNSERQQIGSDTRSQEYQISWRFVTNSGQDDTVIRPVIGKLGIPFYPGSSMKGAFRRVCTPAQIDRYCGRNLAGGDFAPGILRFHGGYPINDNWQDGLIDIVHPQQNWQVKDRNKGGGAFCQISLYQPLLKFTISSNESLSDAEWETIWQLWGSALDLGIGCRVSAGYGRVETQQQQPFYSCSISGEGGAAKIFEVGAEFRPNIFKAAIRGHALRIFGGLTTPEHAERVVDELFGGIARDSTKVGLLGINFIEQFPPRIEMFGPVRWQVPTYEVTGQLVWNLTTTLPEAEQKTLLLLIRNLTRFAMIFGGFGKSWRRADHRIFLPSYNDDGTREKALIGCHWKWGNKSLKNNYMVREVQQIGGFIERLRDNATNWLTLKGIPLANSPATSWRETWHPDRVQVWARSAYDDGDSLAVRWFHGEYTRGQSIARSDLTGSTNLVGRIWHRMYPVAELVPSKKDPQVTISKPTDSFLEIITIFPDRKIPQCPPFLQYLQQQGEFTKVWGN